MPSCAYLTYFNQNNNIDCTKIISILFCCIKSFKKPHCFLVFAFRLFFFFFSNTSWIFSTMQAVRKDYLWPLPFPFTSCPFDFPYYLTVSHLFSILPFALISPFEECMVSIACFWDYIWGVLFLVLYAVSLTTILSNFGLTLT